jgi:cytochrome c-type biogenesis protein CcmH/NrfG
MMILTMQKTACQSPLKRVGVRALVLIAACQLLAVAPGSAAPLPKRVVEADDYFLGRAKLENVQQGVVLLKQEASENPHSYEAWWRLAKFYNYMGRRTQGNERVKYLDAGIEAGKKAVALQTNRVEGHFWLGANYGLKAEESNWFDGLRLIDPVRREMETTIKLDPDYEEASGLRTLARVYYRAPFFKGGDKRRSIELLEECLRRYPEDSMSMLYLADSYIAVDRRDDARKILERMLSLCPDPDYSPELADNQAEARNMLTKELRTGK